MKYPLVSIRMASYNTEAYIENAIKCVFKDLYFNKELIIVDDCSTDNTRNIIKKYKSCPFIKIIYLDKNYGNPYALNVAYEYCRGDIIAKLDSDDMQDIERISMCVKKLENYDLVCSKAKFLLSDGSLIEHSSMNCKLNINKYMNLERGKPMSPSIVGWKSFYDKIGPLREDYKKGSDGVWIVKAILNKAKWGFIDKHLYFYRIHKTQLHYQQNKFILKNIGEDPKEYSISREIRRKLKNGEDILHML